jgi:hypothetical protein
VNVFASIGDFATPMTGPRERGRLGLAELLL